MRERETDISGHLQLQQASEGERERGRERGGERKKKQGKRWRSSIAETWQGAHETCKNNFHNNCKKKKKKKKSQGEKERKRKRESKEIKPPAPGPS